MAPNNLDTLSAELRGLSRRFDDFAARTREDLTEIKADGKETKLEVRRTNGRVTDIENREKERDGETSGRRRLMKWSVEVLMAGVAIVSAGSALLLVVLH